MFSACNIYVIRLSKEAFDAAYILTGSTISFNGNRAFA